MTKFSIFFGGITKTIPDGIVDINEVSDIIKTDVTLKLLCESVQKIVMDDKKEEKKARNQIKKKFSYITPAGIFSKRENDSLVTQSGYAAIDIDEIEGDIQAVKHKLSNDPYISLLFISPSGSGLKALIKIPIDPVSFSDRVKTFYSYLNETYNIKNSSLDKSTCDISRACYLAYDPDIIIKESKEFERLDIVDVKPVKRDNSRSALEYREIIKLLFAGRDDNYIYSVMGNYSKWSESSEAYREHTLKKAKVYVENCDSFTAAQKKSVIPELARNIMDNNKIVSIRSDKNQEMWIYRDGIYQNEAITYIQEMLGEILKDKYDMGIVTKVIDFIKKDTYQNAEEFFTEEDTRYVCLQNGILDIFTNKLYDFSDSLKFFNKLPVEYNPSATCFTTLNHFETILKDEDIPLMQELYGYLLFRSYKIQRAFMFSGDGGNGKGKTLGQMEALLGARNICNISLNQLERDNFIKGSLHGKLANLGADLGKTDIKETSTFRELTGEDLITAPRKFLDPIEFKNYAKMIFAVNTVPHIDEESDGFWRRWISIPFPVTFLNVNDYETRKEKGTLQKYHRIMDVDIGDKLTSPEELSGVLNWALEGLKRLMDTKDFSYNKSYNETKLLMQKRESSAVSFIYDCIEETETDEYYLTQEEMYSFYRKYCRFHFSKMKAEIPSRFKKHLENHGFSVQRKRTAHGDEYRWYYVRFKPDVYKMIMEGQ